MKIRRFVAKDTRLAMRQVREALGADAVILTNRRLAGGVEIIAANDYNESLLSKHAKILEKQHRAADTSAEKEQGLLRALNAEVNQASENATMVQHNTASSVETISADPSSKPHQDYSQDYEKRVAKVSVDSEEHKITAQPAPGRATRRHLASDNELDEMRIELKNLRGLLEHQLSGLAWHDLKSRKPMEAELLKRFLLLGLEPNFCRQMAAQIINILPRQADFSEVWAEAMDKLAALIPVLGQDVVNEQSHVVALVGPTGVGKTSTLAKLATRYVIEHGSKKIGLITLDNKRIGATEQLRSYARILGASLRVATNEVKLQQAIDSFYDKELIVIDTPGMNDWQEEVAQQLQIIKKTIPVDIFLTLSATSQYSVLSNTMTVFKKKDLKGCILTKIDEAVSLGEAISAVIQQDLPIAYYTNGQKVPEDINVAIAHQLVSRAVQLAQGSVLEENSETLALQLKGMLAEPH